MNSKLKKLVSRRFSVYVGGDFERMTDFLGLIDLLARYSDFFRLSSKEKEDDIKEWLEDGKIYIDADIFVRFKK
jgi:hypothetical protein